jgi:TolB-like protein
MVRIARLAALLAVAGFIARPAAPLAAQGTAQTVMVVPFNLHDSPRDDRDFTGVGSAIADLLAADLHAGGVQVIDHAPAARTAALQPKTRGGMVGRQGAVDAAKLLGATRVVYGGVSVDAAGNVRLDARAVNVGTGAVEFTERLQGRGDDVVALVHQLASRLASGMSLPFSAGGAQNAPLPLAAMVTYGKGLEAAARGDRAQARQLLEGVVRDHPDFAPAKAALAASGSR